MSERDEAWERLRAADPAIGHHPDLTSLSDKVAAKVAESDPDLAVRAGTDRRAPRGSWIAAAAALAIGMGAGGYALGAGSAGDTGEPDQIAGSSLSSDDGTDMPETMAGESGGDDAGRYTQMSTPDESTDDTDTGGGVDTQGTLSRPGAGAGYASVLHTGPGISTETGTGEVLMPLPSEHAADQMLQEWADRIGVTGEIQSEDFGQESWANLQSDTINMSASSGRYPSLDYYDNAYDYYWCEDDARSLAPGRADDDSEGTVDPMPQPVECGDPVEIEPIDEETAITLAEEFLADAGVDPDTYELSVRHTEAERIEIAGVTTDAVVATRTQLTLRGDAIHQASVQLPIEYSSLGDYPVISAAEAVERLNDRKFTSWQVNIPRDDEYLGSPEEWTEPEPVTLAEGDPVPYPVTEATITEAQLTTGLLGMRDGTEVVVPAYDLRDEQGRSYSMIAVADEALDFTG